MPEPLWKAIARKFGIDVPPEPEEEAPIPYDENYFKNIYNKVDTIGRPDGLTDPNRTLGKATSIGRMTSNVPPPRTYSGEFLRDYPTIGHIFKDIGLDPIDSAEGGKAGLPFTAYRKILPLGFVTHGTQRKFDTFSGKNADRSDVLGWLQPHAAEQPTYSGGYAMGHHKGIKSVSDNPLLKLNSQDLTSYQGTPIHPRMIPMVAKAENTLDLVDPKIDDLSAAVAALDDYDKRAAIDAFKRARRDTRAAKTGEIEEYNPQAVTRMLGIDPRHIEHRGTDLSYDEIPARYLAERLRLNPDTFKKTQFDAVRYNDMSEKSWAFPEDTPLETPYGVPLNETPKPLKVTRLPFNALTAPAEVRPDRWQHVPLSLPDTPPPTPFKDIPGYTEEPIKSKTKTEPFQWMDDNEMADDIKSTYDNVMQGSKSSTSVPINFNKSNTGNKTPSTIFDNLSPNDYKDQLGPPLKQSSLKNDLGGYTTGTSPEEIMSLEGFPLLPGMHADQEHAAFQHAWEMLKAGKISQETYYAIEDKLGEILAAAKKSKGTSLNSPKKDFFSHTGGLNTNKSKMVYYNGLPGYNENTGTFKFGKYMIKDKDGEIYPANFTSLTGSSYLKELLANGSEIVSFTAPEFK